VWTSLPRDEQLPPSLFKIHVHVHADPLAIVVPTLAGDVELKSPGSGRDLKSEYENYIKQFELSVGSKRDYQSRLDYGAALTLTHRYSEAVAALVALENEFPGRYETAANLGTAYELVGNLSKAIEWIREGIRRNANSHEGTEWLHLAILETKQKIKADPGWLRRHSVLEGHDSKTREEKLKALEYQLNERLYFIRKGDDVMCDLFFQAAVLTDDPVKRNYLGKQANRFGYLRSVELKAYGIHN
jgi:tetratricopeptide (TPR) repeat protein